MLIFGMIETDKRQNIINIRLINTCEQMKQIASFRLFVIVLAFLALGNSSYSDFVTRVSPTTVTEGQRFQISYVLDAEGRNFVPPNFGNDIKVLSGPNQSSSMRIINGNMSRELSFSYIAVAQKVGRIEIPGASIVVDGSRVSSNTAYLNVVEQSEAEKQAREAAKQQEAKVNQQATQIIRDNLYIKVSVSKKSVYEGEQLTANYKLYLNSALNVMNLEPENTPTFTGFWTQDFDMEKQWQEEIIGGARFRTMTLKKVVLIPNRTGTLYIEPYDFKATVRLNTGGRRSIFDDFFSRGSYRDFEYSLSSPRVAVDVKALPEGAPESFAGAVGDVKMEAFFDKTETPAGEPITLKVSLNGTGNLKLLSPPELDFPPAFEVYDPKTADNVSVTTSGSKGDIRFEYLLIPRSEGRYNIGPLEYSYFDLETKEYKTLSSEEFVITVSEGDGSSEVVSSSGGKRVELLNKDIRYIKTESGSAANPPVGFFGSFLHILLSMIPLVGLIFLIFAKKKRKEEDKDELGTKQRAASKMAKKRLTQAQAKLKQQDIDGFYIEILKALWGYLSDKLAVPISDLTLSNASERLRTKGANDNQIAELQKLVSKAEEARYAPSIAAQNTEDVYNRTKTLLTNIEEGIS
ncbi:MAG: BatD family protein [Candidatus Kapaibacteriales bacterium]